VAIAANTGITADATELSIDPATRMLHATRPSFGGNLMATILCEKHRPEMATVRPMAFPRAPERKAGREKW
jgi:electron transfer flavoprotein alpha subunit